MRTLILLRGAPGAGKTMFCRENGLEPYVLSSDTIRLMYQSPVPNLNGRLGISQEDDNKVWDLLFNILEKRMANGDFTVIDATNSKTSEMHRYKTMAQTYRYRVFCVDFTDVNIDECKRRNALRPEYKRVPDASIDKMYARFATQPIPSGITRVVPENGTFSEEDKKKIFFNKINLDKYDKVHVFGDIHGCLEPLKKYIDHINPNEFYIFNGDYVDRGLQNVETLKFLMPLAKLDNVLFLEGNHEKHLWAYAHNTKSNGRDFEEKTRLQLDASDITKTEIRKFYRTLGQCAYFDYHGRTFTVCHGGINTLPNSFISTKTYIKGVGTYAESSDVEDSFFDNTSENDYMIHGHRNIFDSPIQVNDRCFNIEGAVEFGGCLRIIEITPSAIIPHEIENTVYAMFDFGEIDRNVPFDVAKTVQILRNARTVKERKEGNISSFNFTRDAFRNKHWTDATIKARGLFINTAKNEIVARGYEKFFNINERAETTIELLKHNLKFPVTAYVKENGFLGIFGYDEESDDFIVASKSTMNGPYSKYFRDLLMPKIKGKEEDLKKYFRKNNKCMVFEAIDIINDPHIIEYEESDIVLLDVIDRNVWFSKLDYDELVKVSKWLGVKVKDKAFTFEKWDDFFNWYNEVTAEGYLYNGNNIEGFVIEDSAGFMTKLKLHYYQQWKFLRSVADATLKFGYYRHTNLLNTPLVNDFYNFVKTIYNEEYKKENVEAKSIIELRKMFLEAKA